MKTIILYASKYGASHEISRRIVHNMPEASLYDLKKGNIPALSGFDYVIIGGSVYAGILRKEAKSYTEKNSVELSGMKLGLFLSGLHPDINKTSEFFKINFPKEVLSAAKATAFLGGVFDPAKASFIDKLIFSAAAKQSSYVSNILDDKIKEFTSQLQKN